MGVHDLNLTDKGKEIFGLESLVCLTLSSFVDYLLGGIDRYG